MCFRINQKETKKLQESKVPILTWKYVSVDRGGYLRSPIFRSSGRWQEEKVHFVEKPKDGAGEPYNSSSLDAGTGLYSNRNVYPSENSYWGPLHLLLLETNPEDVLGANKFQMVAAKTKVLKAFTSKEWSEYTKSFRKEGRELVLAYPEKIARAVKTVRKKAKTKK